MLTEEQEYKIEEKKMLMPDALQRSRGINYKEGYFFITLNTRDRVPVLGTIEGKVGVLCGQTDVPHVQYSELGQKILGIWQAIPQYHPQVEVIAAEVMPEHFHGFLYLKPEGDEHLGRVVNGFMIGCTHAYWDVLGIQWREMQRKECMEKSAIAHKTKSKWQDIDHTQSFRGPAIFVRGYNEVEAITPQEVQTKIDYIHTQAEKRLIKRQQPICFYVHKNQSSNNWSKEIAMQAIKNDSYLGNDATACKYAQEKVAERLLNGLDWMGNKDLLLSAKKLPLICHRADINLFEQQKEAILTAAQNGAVIVSAFISPKEREIRDVLFREQLPVIEIIDNGFSQCYKPFGKAFYACAENRLVQITPWKYLYQRDSKISREMCLVMNQLCRTICQCDDNWWKK